MSDEFLTLTDHEIDRLAQLAIVHRRSVERRLLGLPVRGGAGRRIDRVLATYRREAAR